MSLAMRQEHAEQFPHGADVGARGTSDTRLVTFAHCRRGRPRDRAALRSRSNRLRSAG
jgi:hypothetical protein